MGAEQRHAKPHGSWRTAPWRPGAGLVGLWLLFAALLAASCTGSSSPSETVKAIYEAANEGDYETFEGYYSEDMARAMDGGMGQVVGGTQGLADYLTRGGIVERVEITSEEIRGEGAEVSHRVYYDEAAQESRDEGDLFKEENPEGRDITLIREDGSWKMSAANFTR